jgi:Clp amino terminal domain, pathogenicity island component
MTPLDPSLLDSAKGARERLVDAQHAADEARVDYQYAIRKLHAGGGSMREIAEELGLSHQRVHQIVDAGDTSEEQGVTLNIPWFGRGRKRGGGGPFTRFRAPARAAIVHAQDEARELQHEHIGTEHILLGVLRAEDGVAAPVLRSLGVTLEATRDRVVEVIGRGPGEAAGARKSGGRIPFTPRAKKALELALREALRLKHDHIGTEHLLLGLVCERDGVAAEILTAQGADAETVRAAVERALEA